jgi:hypothetical protein
MKEVLKKELLKKNKVLKKNQKIKRNLTLIEVLKRKSYKGRGESWD